MADNPKLLEQGDRYAGRGDFGEDITEPGWITTKVTLLDLFAAFSLLGYRASSPESYKAQPRDVADLAYRDAHAMPHERSKQ